MGQKEISFDAARFEYVGAVAKVEIACGFAKASGIDSAEKWLASKFAPRLGGTAPGTGGHDTSRLLQRLSVFPLQLVLGLQEHRRNARGDGEGRADTGCARGGKAFARCGRNMIDSGELVIVLQALPKPHPELPKVPLAINLPRPTRRASSLQIGVHDVSAAIAGRSCCLPARRRIGCRFCARPSPQR